MHKSIAHQPDSVAFPTKGSMWHFSAGYATSGSHQVLGMVVLAMTAAQLALGLLAHCTWQGRGKVHAFRAVLH